MLGEKVFPRTINTQEFNMRADVFPKGIYFVELVSCGKRASGKVVLE